jgi:hypothetical protein
MALGCGLDISLLTGSDYLVDEESALGAVQRLGSVSVLKHGLLTWHSPAAGHVAMMTFRLK